MILPDIRPRAYALALLMGVLVLKPVGPLLAAKPIIIKMATLAPDGSPWHEVLVAIAQDWRKISKDQVRLRIYAGGVIGDETDMVRKMRIGQIHAAALTAEGLSYIDRGIYGLSLPMLVSNFRELDWMRSQLNPEFERRYAEKGYRILAWADVGWVYWFSRSPAQTPDEMRTMRLFTWAGDPHGPKLWKAAGFQTVALSAVDVLPGLQTGMIDIVDSSPLTVASFQWFGIAKYMLDMPWAPMTGALIIREEIWDQVPEHFHQPLMEAVERQTARIHDEIRYMDNQAVEAMLEHGLVVVPADDKIRAAWQELAVQYTPLLRGTLVDSAMYDTVIETRRQMPDLANDTR